MENEYEVEVEILPDDDPFEVGFKAGVMEMRKKVLAALEDGSECGDFAADIVRSL